MLRKFHVYYDMRHLVSAIIYKVHIVVRSEYTSLTLSVPCDLHKVPKPRAYFITMIQAEKRKR